MAKITKTSRLIAKYSRGTCKAEFDSKRVGLPLEAIMLAIRAPNLGEAAAVVEAGRWLTENPV